MNILWINHRDRMHPQAGGAEVRIHEIASRLVDRGHRVTLLAEKVPGRPRRETVDGVEVLRLGGRLGIHAAAPIYVARHSGRYDVVIDDIAHAIPWYSPLFTRRPVIAQIHHIHQDVVHVELNRALARVVAGLERTIPLVYRSFIAVSESTRRLLSERLGVDRGRISVVPNGVDTRRYRPGPKSREPTVLWIGRIKRYKNLDHLIRAYRIVERRVPGSRLLIAGDGDARREAEALARRLGLRSARFLGRVSEAEKIMLLRSSWVIVSTSMVEGWGLTITEAGASGTPAAAYRVPGLVDSVIHGETGLLVEPGDVEALAEAIIRILTDEELRLRLSRGAYMYARRLDWGVIADRFLNEVERLSQDDG